MPMSCTSLPFIHALNTYLCSACGCEHNAYCKGDRKMRRWILPQGKNESKMYDTPTQCQTLECIFLTTKSVLKNNVETTSADKMAFKFSLNVPSLV